MSPVELSAMIRPQYDCIIVGGGISGLYCAREMAKAYPTWSIAVLERYKGLGGRTYSYSPPGYSDIQWEMGAARIHSSHTAVHRLIKEYGLTAMPISSTIGYQSKPGAPIIPNHFQDTLVPIYIEPLQRLPDITLATHTLEELLHQLYGIDFTKTLLSYFPYRSEVTTLRADLAIASLSDPKGVANHTGYSIVKEGYSALIQKLREDCERHGVIILNRHRVMNCLARGGSVTDIVVSYNSVKEGGASGQMTLRATRATIMALHRDAVAELPVFRGWSTLSRLKTEPLLRIYAVFPVRQTNGKGDRVWFESLGRVVTPERPRYIIPINPMNGTIMISYADGDDTREYRRLYEKGGDKAVQEVVMKDIRRLFPDRVIPTPRFFKCHMWETGCTYWLPGTYTPETVSEESCHPLPTKLPGVWMCGESWSMKQTWVEGALQQTDRMLYALQEVYPKN